MEKARLGLPINQTQNSTTLISYNSLVVSFYTCLTLHFTGDWNDYATDDYDEDVLAQMLSV